MVICFELKFSERAFQNYPMTSKMICRDVSVLFLHMPEGNIL